MRAQARWVEVVVTNVERWPAGHDEPSRWGVDLMLILKARWPKIGHRAGIGPWIRHVGLRLAAIWVIRVLKFLRTTLGASGSFSFGSLDVTLLLKLGDELLDNVDLEIVEGI
jgi:hypothetical protein